MPARKRTLESEEDESEESEEEEKPTKKAARKKPGPKRGKKVEDSDDEAEEDDSSEEEIVKKSSKKGAKKAAKKGAKKPGAKRGRKMEDSDDDDEEEDDSSEEEDTKKKSSKKSAKKATKKSAKKPGGKASKDKEEEEAFKWWEHEDELDHPNGEKWLSLKHSGPIFAPPYEPHGIPIKYEGKTFTMTPAEEEVATMFAVMRESDYYKVAVFRENFFRSWIGILHKRAEGKKVQNLALCNFDAIWEWYLREREKKKSLTPAEKRANKLKVEEDTAKYRYVLWDGRKEKIANPAVEPPGLFRGRGKHPKQGNLKKRIFPEDVTINCEDVNNPPPPPTGTKWGSVICDKTVTWLAKWHDQNTGDVKYTMLDRSGTQKQRVDREKFEKARELKKIIEKVRANYEEGFKSKDQHRQQLSVAMYFIDILALRVGGDKSEEEADTVGCCSLRWEHLKLFTRDEGEKKQYLIHFDFLGKDSVRYVNDVEISKEVYGLVGQLMRGKDARQIQENQLFNLVTPSALNAHFKTVSGMQGLTAKVFRTYNASHMLDMILHNEPVDSSATEAEKKVYFDNANKKVAILCNHQKAVSKNHNQVLGNMNIGLEELENTLEFFQKAKSDYDKARGATAKDKVFEKYKKEFNYGVDERLDAWFTKWGSEKEKKTWAEKIKTGKAILRKRKRGDASKKDAEDDDDDEEEDDASESEEPVTKKAKKAVKKSTKKPAAKRGKVEDSDDDDEEEDDESEEEVPKKSSKKSAKKNAKKPTAKRGGKVEDSEDDDDDDDEEEEDDASEEEVPAKKAAKKSAKRGGKVQDSEDEEEDDASE